MTKQHFTRAAAMVKAIHDGEWTHERPDWEDKRYTLTRQQWERLVASNLSDELRAAAMVKAIHDGKWIHERPSWEDKRSNANGDDALYDASAADYDTDSQHAYDYTRAVQTAEVFLMLFESANPRFDRARFLYACGLGPKPVTQRRMV